MTVDPKLLRDILLRARYLVANMPAELQEAGLDRIRALTAKIRPLLREKVTIPSPEPEAPEPTPQIQVPEIARQLWTLARGNPDVFELYMKTYPNEAVQSIGNNPAQLNSLVYQINNTQNVPPRGTADGFTQTALQSSNIFGTRYDPLRKSLRVRFQNGSVYRYEGVPKIVHDLFAAGQGTCKTSGKNKYGFWFVNKNPSMGAAFHELIKLGNYPFQKIK